MNNDSSFPIINQQPGQQAQTFTIASTQWAIGEALQKIGTKVLEISLLKTSYPNTYKTVVVNGKFIGRASDSFRRYGVSWELPSGPVTTYYPPNHSIWKKTDAAPAPLPPPQQPAAAVPGVSMVANNVRAPAVAVNNAPVNNNNQLDDDDEDYDLGVSYPDASDDDDDDQPASLTVGGRTWREDRVLDNVDAHSSLGGLCTQNEHMNWPHPLSETAKKTEMDYVRAMIPNNFIETLVGFTNVNLLAKGKPVTTKAEIWKWLGIITNFPIYSLPNINDYWMTGDLGINPMPAFGERTGMSRDRWRLIRECLAFWDSSVQTNDPWHHVRLLFSIFNDNMESKYTPGTKLVLDESMIRWRGFDENVAGGPPHITHMPLKPESLGFLVKNTACGASRTIIKLELQEEAAAMEKKEFCDVTLKTTACVLRLTKPWHGSKRVVVADSWFCNEKTAVELHRRGLFFIGVVKQGHACIPKKWMNENAFTDASPRGATKLLHSVINGNHRMVAVAWNEPKKRLPDQRKIRCSGANFSCQHVIMVLLQRLGKENASLKRTIWWFGRLSMWRNVMLLKSILQQVAR